MLPLSSPARPDSRPGLTAAAGAAAGWARRQLASRSAAVPLADTPNLEPAAELDALPPEEGRYYPSGLARAGAWLRSLPSSLWLTSVGMIAVVAFIAAVGSAVTTYWSSGPQATPIEQPVGPVAPAVASVAVPVHKAAGRLRISSEPPGARVRVDGRFRGMTPLALDDLAPGEHAIVLESAGGSVSRTVIISATEPVVLEERIFSGWVAVYAPFDLIVSEGAKALALDDRHQIMLPPGPHALRLQNRALGYDETRQVDVMPGGVATLQVAPPRSALTVKANEDAQVWVDGVLAGDTPLVTFAVALGTHEVVVKRAGDERRFIVTSTVKPVELIVDFSRPGA